MKITKGSIFHTADESWLVALTEPGEDGLFEALDTWQTRTYYHVGSAIPVIIPAAELPV